MREESDQLQQDVQRLTDIISSSPVLASQYAMSRPRRHEEETLSTPAPTSKLTPLSGHQDPRQCESAPQVPFSDESLHPQGSQRDLIEELSDSLNGAGLPNQHAVHSPATSGESSPRYKDFPPQTPEGRESPPPQGSSAVEQSQPHHQEGRDCPPPGAVHSQPVNSYRPHHDITFSQPDGRYRSRPDDAYRHHDDSHSQPAASYRQPSLRAHHDDRYYWQDGRQHPPVRRSRPEDRYRPAYGYVLCHLCTPSSCPKAHGARRRCPSVNRTLFLC